MGHKFVRKYIKRDFIMNKSAQHTHTVHSNEVGRSSRRKKKSAFSYKFFHFYRVHVTFGVCIPVFNQFTPLDIHVASERERTRDTVRE